MTAQDLRFDDLSPLLAALCDGVIGDDDFKRLQQILLGSAQARAWYIEYMDLHGELSCGQVIHNEMTFLEKWTRSNAPLADESLLSSTVDEYPICIVPSPSVPQDLLIDDEEQEFDDEPCAPDGLLIRGARQIVSQLTREGVIPWIAAVAMFGAMVFAISKWDLPEPSSQVVVNDVRPQPAAWVSQLHEVEWAAGQPSYGWGAAVMPGNALRLKSGLVRLVFSSGAEVLLQGPVSFTAETAESGRLRVGRLVARAETDLAQGFTIRTPTAQIVDLGTEFGVTVDEQGQTETHVFAGHVLAQAIGVKRASSEPVRLKAGQAARVETQHIAIRPLAATPEMFVRHVPPRRLTPVVHFAMEEPKGPLTSQQGGHKAQEGPGGGFLYRQPGVPPGTYGAITIGPEGTGFSAGLNKATAQWNLDAAGTARLNLANNFTVMTWLYLPTVPSGIVKVVGLSATDPTAGWSLGVREASAGTGIHFCGNGIGDFYSGSSIPWTKGQWHHIAVTKSNAEGIKFYLDGNLIAAETRPAAREAFERLGLNEFYSLGRGNDFVKEPGNGRRIDEIRVYDTVLTREEIVLAASTSQ